MPRILDNIRLRLSDTLQETLEHSRTLDACVGYFNLRGWRHLSEHVDKLPATDGGPSVRMLIGMQGASENERLRESLRIIRGNQTVDNLTAKRLKEEAARELRKQLTWGVPSAEDEGSLRDLRRQLAEGRVQVKLFLKHNLHAKLYLCHRADPVNPRIGFVGSSNLTFAGLGYQGELNVDVLDHDATEKLHQWFDDRWEERLSLDITEELIEILDESWAGEKRIDPYLIYLKIAWHLSRDARAGLLEFGLPESMRRKLLEFQSAAVRITARNLLSRGGAIVGDVVGLGKTLIATAVALLLQEEQGFETLIVAPKNLVRMWEGYRDTYRVHGQVASLSMVHRELPDLRRYRLVIIDESHNLRNPRRRDYAAIRDYIQRNDPRVLLLTATPFNRSMADVAGQLGLFVDQDQDLGIRPEALISQMGEADFLARCDDKPATLRAFALSEEADDWQRLLAQFLIRRTRNFIKENYADQDEDGRHYLRFEDGDRYYLPDRVPRPLPHDVAEDDPTAAMVADDVLDGLEALKLPRYDLASFVRKGGPTPSPEERGLLDDIARARGNLIGFTRTMLMKRLSSSGAAFSLSLQRHLLRNHVYLQALEGDGHLPVGSVNDSQMLGDSEDTLTVPLPDEGESLPDAPTQEEWRSLARQALTQLSEATPAGVTWVRSDLFTDELRSALEEDVQVIQGLLERFGVWDQSRDSKLDALEKLLVETHPREKVLVFTEYADTARYVGSALHQRGLERVASVTGDTEDPTVLARRFSPRSNRELGPPPSPEEELRVLVATDVLSEGQNLQDSAIVVNFDLPWAIIKLIQRAGRVDRIGQESPEVLVYTFLPNDALEEVIHLRQRIADRLQRHAAVFGSDEQFLGTPGETRIIEALFDENAEFPEQEAGREDVDFASAAYEIWRRAERENPHLAQRAEELPDVTFSTMMSDETRQRGVLVYTRSRFGVDRIAFAPLDGEPIRVSPMEALRLTECDPDTAALPRLERHHELVEHGIARAIATDGASTAEGALSGVRRRVYERVRAFIEAEGQLFSPDETVQEAVDALYRTPLTEHAKQSLVRALRERTPQDVAALVVQLHELGELTIDTSTDVDDIHIVCSMGFSDEG